MKPPIPWRKLLYLFRILNSYRMEVKNMHQGCLQTLDYLWNVDPLKETQVWGLYNLYFYRHPLALRRYPFIQAYPAIYTKHYRKVWIPPPGALHPASAAPGTFRSRRGWCA